MDLLHLQNLAKRDPSSYEEEVQQQYRHFESQMSVMQLQPHAPHEDFVKLLDFVCHVRLSHPPSLTLPPSLPLSPLGLSCSQSIFVECPVFFLCNSPHPCALLGVPPS